jgi:hypothetical protein
MEICKAKKLNIDFEDRGYRSKKTIGMRNRILVESIEDFWYWF